MNTRLSTYLHQPALWRRLAILLAFVASSLGASAQIDTYQFAATSSTYTPLTGGTSVAILGDDLLASSIPLGFTFQLDGVSYTTVTASSNGYLSFGTTPATSSYNNALSTTYAPGDKPLLAVYWDDLTGSGGGNPVASYLTTGTAPNRVFTFEWFNWTRLSTTGPTFSMQAKLFEGTNAIQFIYRPEANTLTTATASIGLAGPVVGTALPSFLSVSAPTANATASATVENASIATVPPAGQVYTFTPAPPSACATPRNLTVGNVTATAAVVSWTVNGGTGPFTIQYGPTGFNPALASTSTNFYTSVSSTTTSYTLTGLTPSTGYQFYVTQVCGGTAGSSNRSNAGAFQSGCITPLYATLPYTESFEGTWINRCDTRDVPNNNWSNTPLTGNASWRREDDGAAANWTSPTIGAYTPTGSQGTHSARFHSYYAPTASIGTMDLYANLSAAGGKRLSFDYINTAGNDSLTVLLSNDGGLTFTRLAAYNLSATFATQVLNVTSTSATAVIRFRAKVTTAFTTDLGLDNVVLESATGCLTPAVLAASGVTANTAVLSWLTGNAGTYTVFYGPTGFNPAQPVSSTNSYFIMAGIAAPPYTLTGLTPSTTYQFYVVQNCAGSANSGIAGPVSFTTACVTPVYATLPFVESFENTWISRCDVREVPNNNWRNTPGTGNPSWRREDDPSAANWTSPTLYGYTPAASQGAHSARFHSGYVTAGVIGTMDLYANLSAAGAKRLSFDFINTSGSDSLVIQLSNDGGVTFSRLAGYNLSATFTTQVLPITSTSATAVIRFRARGDFGSTDIGLDNIILESATGCLTPAALTTSAVTTTTASLSWLTGGTGTYTVLYGPTGFNPTLPSSTTNVYTTATGITAPPYAVTGLAPGTTYQFYVTLNCAGSTTSGTAGPGSFTTQIINDNPCGATVLTINNTCTPLATTNAGATFTTPLGYTNPCVGTATSPNDVWFQFTTSATGPTSTGVRITVTGGPASVVRAFSAAACTGPFTSISCVGTATNIAAPNLDLLNLQPSTTYYVSVSNYAAASTLGNFTICVVPVPNCPAPSGLTVGALTGTTAPLTWIAGSTGGTYNIIYGPGSFTPPTGGTTISGLTTTSTTLTGLTPNTAYTVYVQQVCGGFNGASIYVGPVAFTTPLTAPVNDDPCGALSLTTLAQNGTNLGATTTTSPVSIALGGLPVCGSNANAPKDVWYTFTPLNTTTTLTFTGTSIGSVRLFTLSGTCSTGTYSAVTCQSSTTGLGTVTFTGLTVGTRYYMALAGYASGDTQGGFTIRGTALGNRAQAETNALVVYPNPSNTGQLTLRLSTPNAGSATLLNALGQVVLTKNLTVGTTEQLLSTKGLATGVYTLRVQQGDDVLTRKVVLE